MMNMCVFICSFCTVHIFGNKAYYYANKVIAKTVDDLLCNATLLGSHIQKKNVIKKMKYQEEENKSQEWQCTNSDAKWES